MKKVQSLKTKESILTADDSSRFILASSAGGSEIDECPFEEEYQPEVLAHSKLAKIDQKVGL